MMLTALIQHNELSQQLTETGKDLWALLPEISITATLIFLILFDLAFKKNKSLGLASIAFVGLAFTFALLVQQWHAFPEPVSLMGELLNLNRLAILLKSAFVIGLAVALIIALQARSLEKDFFATSEVMVMLFGLLLGTMFMTMSGNLLLIYLSIELVSICSYVLTGITKGKKKSEAAIKYLIYGAVASAIMLYGMSWLYGFTGTLNITSPVFISGLEAIPGLPLSIATLMVLGGFIFKLGAFPLHIWSPDVYEAAPTPVVAVFSVLPKLAALSIIFRFASTLNVSAIDWQLWLGIISIASMTVGNFSALWQKDVKRMLAYSSIAHAGFLLVGIITFTSSGGQAMLFYAMIYLIMNLAAFFLIAVFEKYTGSSAFDQWKGLGQNFPFLSVLILIVMISLTGLPPTAGFSAKLFIFTALWESYSSGGQSILLWVFIFGLLNTVIALFYYLKLPYLLFFKRQANLTPLSSKPVSAWVWGTLLVIPLLLLFFRSDWFVGFVNSINFVFWIS